MPNKHFCQGPNCHTRTTSDRFLKSRGVIRGRYAYCDKDQQNWYSDSDKFFCSQSCKLEWLSTNMTNIEQGRPIEFIRHRRESGGYEKKTFTHTDYHGNPYTSSSIKRVDNRTELD
jgi:hypothetical protein